MTAENPYRAGAGCSDDIAQATVYNARQDDGDEQEGGDTMKDGQ
ncbi:hypothetical protein [Thioalkalivibrio sp.]